MASKGYHINLQTANDKRLYSEENLNRFAKISCYRYLCWPIVRNYPLFGNKPNNHQSNLQIIGENPLQIFPMN